MVAKLNMAVLKVLSMNISVTHHAIKDNLDDDIHIVGAVLFKPFHYDGKYACQIEFHYIGTANDLAKDYQKRKF